MSNYNNDDDDEDDDSGSGSQALLMVIKEPTAKCKTDANCTYFQRSSWSVKTVVEWQQCTVLWPCFIALFEQHLHIWVWSYLWQEPGHQLRGQHVGVLPQNCPTKSQGICHQHQLSVGG